MTSTNNHTPPADLIGLCEAAGLLPCRKPGRRAHASTVYRWVAEGKLRGWRLGRYWYVSRADVLALVTPATTVVPPAAPPAQDEAARKLRALGWKW